MDAPRLSRRTLLAAAPLAGVAAAARAAPPPPNGGALVPPDPKVRTPPPAEAEKAVSRTPEPARPRTAGEIEPEALRLWPGEPPGAPAVLPDARLRREGASRTGDFRLRGIAQPTLFAYRPARPTGVALIVMPGGGYGYLSMQNEGSNVARVFTQAGWTVFVLGYRLPGEGWLDRADVPMQDAQRALRMVRARAAEFRVDPARIGVLGFSSGGHLAASVATDPGTLLYRPTAGMDEAVVRPAFVGLAYPVTTLEAPLDHVASRRNLLGADPAAELIARRSPLLHVGKATPPCFLVHALDDPIVDPVCSMDWLRRCHAERVPAEAQFLEKGGHGFGMKLAQSNPGAVWPEQFRLWAARHGG